MAFSAFGGPSPSSLHRADRVKNAIPVEAARRSEFGHAVGSNSGCSNLISFSDSTVDSNSGRSNLNLLFRFHALGSHLLHACCNYFNSINPQYTRMRAILETSWALVLMLMSDHLISTTHAAVIAHAVRRDSTVGQPVQPHGLSTEALLTLIGICVAVLGIALAIVQTWPSLKTGWGMCRSRRFQPYQRSRSLYTDGSAIVLIDAHETLAAPVRPAEPWTHSSNGDEIPRPQRVQSCYTEQQRALMRRAHTS